MSQFGERIRALADILGKEHQDIAKDLGLTKSQFSHYTTGKRKVPSDLLQKIVDTYNINPLFLFKEDALPYDTHYKNNNSKNYYVAENTNEYDLKHNYKYIPASVSAGLPIHLDGIKEADEIHIPDSVMGKWAGQDDIFIMKVNGESMNNVMPHGSLIAVKPIEAHQIKDGDIVVYSDGGDYSVKRFYRDENRLIFRPDSSDPSFYDYVTDINNDELIIHGKVVVYIVELD